MNQWEYAYRTNPNDVEIQRLGGSGWELVCVAPVYGEGMVWYFKRELPAVAK